MPLPALACLDHPQTPGGIGLTHLLGVVVANCAVGWAARRIAISSGKHQPAAVANITAVASLFGGPLLWYILAR